jgi:phytoene dehydrogenase-like protein
MRLAKTVIVIGAGMGGLAAAADLARQGCDVTVLERAATPGGKARMVGAGTASVSGGPTVFTMRWIFEQLFSDCGSSLEGALNLSKPDLLGQACLARRRTAGPVCRHRPVRRCDRHIFGGRRCTRLSRLLRPQQCAV